MSDDVDRMSRNDLKREVRRLRNLLQETSTNEDDAELMQVGSGAMLAKAREQRDKYKSERDHLITAIHNYRDRAATYLQDSNERFESWLATLNETANAQPVPHLVAAIL